MGLAGSGAGISHIILPQKTSDNVLAILETTNAELDTTAFADLRQRLIRYFAGDTVLFFDKLDLRGSTLFQLAVWETARQIPRGQTNSYGWIAKRIGKPDASRAVGQALKRNLIPIIIPCHRVISNTGKLGGFSGGLEMKKLLLEIEEESL